MKARWSGLLLVGVMLVGAGVGAHASARLYPHPAPTTDLVRYEDGSGVLYVGDQEVQTFPADTFVWHCATQGNRVCGDVDDADMSTP